MGKISKSKIKLLKKYFLENPEISMAFLFGSRVKGQALFDSVTFTIFYYAAAIYVGTLGSELVKAEETMRVVVAPLAVCSFFLFLDMTVRNGINCLTILVRGKPWGFSKEPWMFRLL